MNEKEEDEMTKAQYLKIRKIKDGLVNKIITVINLKELRMEVNNIWQLLKQLVQKQT